MPTPLAINQLIHSIYQGVLEETPWYTFISKLSQLLNVDIALMMISHGQHQGNTVLLNQVMPVNSELSGLPAQWIKQDPFDGIAANIPTQLSDLDQIGPKTQISPPHISTSDLPPPPSEIDGLELHKILALNLKTQGSSELTLKIRLVKADTDFKPEDTDLLTDMVLHLNEALKLFDHMAIQQIERNAFADAINQFMLGTLILDRNGVVVASNRVARDSIEQYQELTLKQGSLVITDKKANQHLYQTLATIEESDTSDDVIAQTITINTATSAALGLIIRPIRPEDALAYPVHAHAVVFISSSQESRTISATTLKELFGLTDSEAKVAAYLANGHTLTEAASKLSVSINTAKTHARNIYEKTGVNKQTKFIQLVSNSVARVSS